MSKRTLLLADDSITIQKVVNLTFADEGIDVITVGDGNSAMQKISEAAPDVILADVHMPGLSGYQVCEMVRSNEATRGLPVVLLVGSFEPFDENEAARVGANAFLTKPFQSIRQLVSQVSDLMRTSAPASESVSEPVSEEPDVATSEQAAPDSDVDTPIPARAPDTTDIDSLYSQSVGGPSHAESETGPPTYVDAGMDDEMIETVHANADEEPPEEFYQEPTAEHHQPTFEHPQPAEHYQSASEHQQPSEYHQPTAEHQEATSEYPQPTFESPQPAEDYQQPTSEYQVETAGYQEASAFEQPAAHAYQSSADEYREPTVEYHEPSPAYEQRAESVFEEEVPHVPSPFDAPAEETPPVQPHPYEAPYSTPESAGDVSTAPTDEFALDEVDLLELPPMQGGQRIEFTTTPGAEGGKQVVSLSPELMDALVEKVVKKLSTKE